MKKYFTCLCIALTSFSNAQKIKITTQPAQQNAVITIDEKPFTVFNYPDSLAKPFLWPIVTSGGATITRGYPVKPTANEPVDHPHHIGLWLNYENVNGLDFWNNSFAIPAAEKNKYGHIQDVKITNIKNGTEGILDYTANWNDINNNTLLKENTRFVFSADKNTRIIDRITTLTAATDVAMPDVKDGLLGLRVAHAMELPVKDARQFTDANGKVTTVEKNDTSDITGNYINSNGDMGDDAWGKRADWCMLFGKMVNDSVSIAIIDHPLNKGYPTCWHARGYGLFAANPLGQKIFTNGASVLNFSLQKGASVTFRFRVVVYAAQQRLQNKNISALAKNFAELYK